MAPDETGHPPRALVAGFTLFVVLMAALVGGSLTQTPVPVFAPTELPLRAAAVGLVVDTVTLDARAQDRWQFFRFERGAPGDPDHWDLAVRRFHLVAAGSVADAGAGPFETVSHAPEAGYVPTTFGADTVSPPLARWYRYGFFNHVLSPHPRTYVVRTRAGRYAKLEILSYYCPGPTAGCVTFRYAYQPSGGTAFR